MRKLILQMQYSLDGFIGGPNGELDWIFPDFDAEFAEWNVEKLWEASAHVMGSNTYREMAADIRGTLCGTDEPSSKNRLLQ